MKKTMLILGTVAILCAVLFRYEFVEKTIAQTPATENAVMQADDATVELRLLVLDEEKNPVPGTLVKCSPEGCDPSHEMTWTTDKYGRIVAKIPLDIANSSTSLILHNADRGLMAWESLWKQEWSPNDPLEFTYTVFKARRLTGTVIDPDGKPVADAFVGYGPSMGVHTKTDKDGKFVLDAMRFCPIMIYAVHPTIGAATA